MPAPEEEQVTRLVVRGLGVDVGLEVVGTDLARAVRSAWRDALSCDVGSTAITLRVALGLVNAGDVTGETVAEVMHHISPAVTMAMIEQRAGELVMLHAAALADSRTGATAVLVAPSGTGKTTAAATLGRSMTYVTDETAAITPDGEVLPYRKPLSVIETGHHKTQRSPTELGLRTCGARHRLAALLVLDRHVDHQGAPRSEHLPLLDALTALTPENSYLARLERPLHRLADVVELAGGAHRVTYREVADLAPLIGLLVGADR